MFAESNYSNTKLAAHQ